MKDSSALESCFIELSNCNRQNPNWSTINNLISIWLDAVKVWKGVLGECKATAGVGWGQQGPFVLGGSRS